MSAPADGWLLRFLRRGVLKHLSVALHDSKDALSCEWVGRDPDLRAMRDSDDDPDWRMVMERHCGDGERTRPVDPDWEFVQRNAPLLLAELSDLGGHPDRPWGDPARRHYAWSAGAVLLGAAVLVMAGVGLADTDDRTDTDRVPTVVALLAALATMRAVLLAKEAWRARSAEPPTTRDAAGWRTVAFRWSWIAFALGLGALIGVGLENVAWQVPFVLALCAVLATVWAFVATRQAARRSALAAEAAERPR